MSHAYAILGILRVHVLGARPTRSLLSAKRICANGVHRRLRYWVTMSSALVAWMQHLIVQASIVAAVVTVGLVLLSALLRLCTRRPSHSPRHVVVVVLGDIGRSPRMQYHCMSLAELPATSVS